jgi:3-phosphoshikimate 1-carboxyvinyltransferase
LHGIEYTLPVASAQVKSCVLLAGLLAEGRTTVIEPEPSRDHTERLLARAGVRVERDGARITVTCQDELELGSLHVPGDPSSAAFHIAAAVLVRGSRIVIADMSANWTRTGFIRIAERMGAVVVGDLEPPRPGEIVPEEPVCELDIASGPLVATEVSADEVPLAIDELPLFALAAACARGESVLRGAEERRAKETDRIEATVDALRALGVRARGRDDGLAVTGVPARLRGGRISSRGDHRIAMLGAVAGLASRDGVRIEDAGAVAVSFPGFFELVDGLRRTARTRSRWDE